MKANKIFFIGLGGAGQRHVRVFRNLLPPETEFSAFRSVRKTPLLNSDFSVDYDRSIENKYNIRLFNSIEEGFDNKPNLVVISTPTSMHFDVAMESARRKLNIFIEKPFSHDLTGFVDFKKKVIENNLCFFISFQRRFHNHFRKIKDFISRGGLGNVISAVFNVCTYVPEWHPYEDFRSLYACRRELGGGVLLTEIHEIDLSYWYFGLPDYVYCTGGNYSDTTLDVEDSAHIVLKYKKYAIVINLCFMQKHARRDFYIAGTKGYVEWNACNNSLLISDYKNNKKEINSDPDFTNDMMFFAQADYFLKKYDVSENKSYLDMAESSLAIVLAAKESMAKGCDIKISN